MFVRLAILFGSDRKAGTAIEYGLLATVVAITAIGGIIALGGGTGGMWEDTGNQIVNALQGSG